MDRLKVRGGDDDDQRRDRHADSHRVVDESGPGKQQRQEDLLSGVCDRGKGVRGKDGKVGYSGKPLVLFLVRLDRLSDKKALE